MRIGSACRVALLTLTLMALAACGGVTGGGGDGGGGGGGRDGGSRDGGAPPATYTLTPSAGANGTITPATAQTVSAGASVTFTITPDATYAVKDVLVDGTSVGPVTSYTFKNVTADHTIAASFALQTFTLTYTAGPHGSLTGDATQTVDYGASGTAVTAVPDAGYVFMGWSDGSTANPRTDANVTADLSVAASFLAQGTLVLDGSSLTAIAAGESSTFTVALGATPSADPVQVTVTSADPTHLKLGQGDCTSPTDAVTLTFDSGTWDTPQPLVACALDGGSYFGGAHIPVTAAVDDAATAAIEYQGVSATLKVTVIDSRIVYVKPTATGTGDGSSWANAMGGATTLQTIVNDATKAGKAVWVAAGRYTASAAKKLVLEVPGQAAVYGSFAGTEQVLADRADPMPRPTSLLDGDFNGDDATTGNLADNAPRVVHINTLSSCTLDGFQVSGGDASGGNGGGVWVEAMAAKPGSSGGNVPGPHGAVLSHLLVKGNRAGASGGGVMTQSQTLGVLTPPLTSKLELSDSIIQGNLSQGPGGGFYDLSIDGTGQVILKNVVIVDNVANGQSGGGVMTTAGMTLSGCVLMNNRDSSTMAISAQGSPGGNFADDYQPPAGNYPLPLVISNTSIIGGRAREGGGAYITGDSMKATLRHDTFLDNLGRDNTGGLYIDHGASNFRADTTVDISSTSFRGNVNEHNCGDVFCATALSAGLQTALTVVNSGFQMNRAPHAPSNFPTTLQAAGADALHLVNDSLYQNDGGILTGCGDTTIDNTVFYGMDPALSWENCNVTKVDYVANQKNTMRAQITHQHLLTSDPFDVSSASGELFQVQTGNVCIDNGHNAYATDAGIPWQQMSTRKDLTVPANNPNVDLGRSFDPLHPVVDTFAKSAQGNLSWSTRNATRCMLLDFDGTATAISMDLPLQDDGTQGPTAQSGHTYYLRCEGAPDLQGHGQHTVARLAVP